MLGCNFRHLRWIYCESLSTSWKVMLLMLMLLFRFGESNESRLLSGCSYFLEGVLCNYFYFCFYFCFGTGLS